MVYKYFYTQTTLIEAIPQLSVLFSMYVKLTTKNSHYRYVLQM